MKRIQSLPDLCLLTIFDRIPLDDLTRIGHVCQSWYSLKSSALTRRQHLSLFVYKQEQKPERGIQLKCFTGLTTQKVIKIFPNVTSLTIEHEDEQLDTDSIDPVALPNLFTHQWSSKLVSLHLIMTYQFFQFDNVSIIVEAINNLASLKRLSFIESSYYDIAFKPQFRIIAQLEEFSLLSEFYLGPYDWLPMYAEGNTALRKIELDSVGCNEEVELLLKLAPELAHKFTSLYTNKYDLIWLDNSMLTRLCLHFTSLRRINISQCALDSTFAERLTCLTPLKQLNTLGLMFNSYSIDEVFDSLEIEPFESVTKLALSFPTFQNDNDHKTLQFMDSFNFVYLFPKLEFVNIDYDFDDEDDLTSQQISVLIGCFDEGFEREIKTDEQKRSHYESMIEPLKKCEHLREIEYRTDGFKAKWTRNDEM